MVDIEHFSSCTKLFTVQGLLQQFIIILKIKVNSEYNRSLRIADNVQLHRKTWNTIIISDNTNITSRSMTILVSLAVMNVHCRAIPPIILQLNIYLDEEKIVRVRSKFGRWANHNKYPHPMLLSKESNLTCTMYILDPGNIRAKISCWMLFYIE